ncbi:MAG: Ig-like domain-containing protein [Methanobrevibacter sp.]|uniref:Ig-like domain-containing protein n=1 Tax=Methanobrevibacter sp. TaxID=66852 RepID=UPI0025F1D443|nr:Ig-like domain-containing protein [Methanobrevibacter sp.]MBR0272272.1 Ig-like domain-containing protein [Methanobrevibacter sp.]
MKRLFFVFFIFMIFIGFTSLSFASDVADNSFENDILESQDISENISANEYWYESMPTDESETVNYNGGNQDIDFHTIIDDYFASPESKRYFGGLKLYAYVNDDTVHRVELKDYNGAATYIKFNLNLVESQLKDGENKITVHPDESQMYAYTCWQYSFAPATVYYKTESYNYSSTPYPSSLDYVIGDNKTVTININYNDSLNDIIKNLDFYVYINDENTYKIADVGLNREIKLNLYDIRDYLTKENNILFLHHDFNGTSNLSTLYNKLTVNVVEPIYDYYITTPDPSYIDEYVRNTNEYVTVYNYYWEGISEEMQMVTMCVYINDIEGYNWDFIRGVKANETQFTFNLKDISSQLEEGKNTLYFAPYTKDFYNLFLGDNCTFNPLTVYVKKTATVNDYVSTPVPSEVYYKSGEDQNIEVNISYPDTVDLSGYSMFVYINGEEFKDRVAISGVDSGATSFTFNLKDISDKLTEGVNNLTFHPNTGMLEYDIRGELIFNPLRVILSDGIINTTLTVNPTLNLTVNKTSQIRANYTPSSAKITYSSDDESIAVVDENGLVTGISQGIVNITVIVGDDLVYKISNATVCVNVSEASLIDTSIVMDNDTILLNVSDTFAINPTITPEGLNVTYLCSDEDIVKLEGNVITALKEGSAVITLTVGDNVTYKISSLYVNVTVLKIKTSLSVDDVLILNESDVSRLNVNITPGDAKGTFSYFSYDTDVATIDDNATVTAVSNGTALISIIFKENDRYMTSNATVTVVVLSVVPPKENLTLEATSDEITLGENATVTVNGFKNACGNVTLSIANSTYSNEIVNGSVSFVILNLTENATAFIYYEGDGNYNNASASVDIVVKNKPETGYIITAENLTKYFHGHESFVVNVTDYEGNPVANKSVEISINGIPYTRTTDENGSASIAINLGAGIYNVTASADNDTVNSTICVLTTVNGSDITKVFRNATQYYATFRDTEGNLLDDGTLVQFNINGVMYYREVIANGTARLNINLAQGTYIITAYNPANNEMASNTITVIAKIVENHDLVKYFRNDSQYVVRILGDDGNPVGANETVTFNINGVMYERKTNESGYAKLNINLSPGEYIITAMYRGCAVANNITVKPTLTAQNIEMSYRDGTQFKAKLVDGQGNPISEANVEFNINGVFYNRTTDSTGTASLNINLSSGKYIITSRYEYAIISNEITIL